MCCRPRGYPGHSGTNQTVRSLSFRLIRIGSQIISFRWWLLIDINKPHGSTNNKQAITVLFDAQTVSVSTRAKKIANQQKAADQHIQFHKYHGKRDTDLESRASGEADDFYLTDVDDETPLLEFVDDEPESESFSNAEFDDVEPESELEETFNLTGGDVDTEEDFDDTETDKDTEILPLSGSELDNEDTVSVDSGDEEVDTEESATEEGASDIEKRGRHRASAAARARAGAQARARDRAAARARRNHRGGRSHSSGRHSRHSHGRSHGRARHSRSHSRHSSAPSPVVGHGKVLGCVQASPYNVLRKLTSIGSSTFYIIASDHLIDQQAAGLTSSIIMSRGIKTTTLSPLKLVRLIVCFCLRSATDDRRTLTGKQASGNLFSSLNLIVVITDRDPLSSGMGSYARLGVDYPSFLKVSRAAFILLFFLIQYLSCPAGHTVIPTLDLDTFRTALWTLTSALEVLVLNFSLLSFLGSGGAEMNLESPYFTRTQRDQ